MNNDKKNKPKVFSSDWWKSLFTPQNGNEPKLLTFYKKEGTKSIIASLIAIVAGILVGFVLMLIIAASSPDVSIRHAFRGLLTILGGPFSSGSAKFINTNFGNMIFYSVPLIMTGLSVAIAFKTGLFNIGAAGQFLMGTMGALLVALNINTVGNPVAGFFVWLLAMVVALVFGLVWGALPGLFKALFNVNEVIVCIMTNWIAANIVSWVFSSTPNLINTGSGKTNYLITTEITGNGTPTIGLDKLFKGSYIDLGIIVAILFAIAVFIILNKTTFGYELRACGSNKHAAKYAGMNAKRNIILSMSIAGGLAAVGGALYYLNPGIEFNWSSAYMNLPAYGFNGIPVALLASSNPIGVIFAGIFLRYILQGGNELTSCNYNQYVADIIVAVIIYFAGFSKLFRDFLAKRQKKLTDKVALKIEKQSADSGELSKDVTEECEKQSVVKQIEEVIEEEETSSPVNIDHRTVDNDDN